MPIKVFLVEDSPVALSLLKKMLDSPPDTQVVGTARTGIEALALIPKAKPDVICTDLYMPKMNGLDLTKEVMAIYPRPILVISAALQQGETQQVFELLDAGAVDVFPKPAGGLAAEYEKVKQQLLAKVKVLSGIKVFTKPKRTLTSNKSYPSVPTSTEPLPLCAFPTTFPKTVKVLAIGTSTGGPQALQTIFTSLPVPFPIPILCVQHISEGFLKGFLDWLKTISPLNVEIAQQGQFPQTGIIYFPPEQRHLKLDKEGRFNCSLSPPVDGHCPSVTELFQSVAQYYGKTSVGVLLTGMGRDGATGLLTIAQAGGFTICQNEITSVVFGMPQEGIKLGAAKKVLPLEEIAPFVCQKIGLTRGHL